MVVSSASIRATGSLGWTGAPHASLHSSAVGTTSATVMAERAWLLYSWKVYASVPFGVSATVMPRSAPAMSAPSVEPLSSTACTIDEAAVNVPAAERSGTLP